VSVNNHTLTAAQMPSHSHTQSGSAANDSYNNNANNGSYNPRRTLKDGYNYNTENDTTSTGGGGSHNHGASGSFSGSAFNNLPTYYALAFIMKT